MNFFMCSSSRLLATKSPNNWLLWRVRFRFWEISLSEVAFWGDIIWRKGQTITEILCEKNVHMWKIFTCFIFSYIIIVILIFLCILIILIFEWDDHFRYLLRLNRQGIDIFGDWRLWCSRDTSCCCCCGSICASYRRCRRRWCRCTYTQRRYIH